MGVEGEDREASPFPGPHKHSPHSSADSPSVHEEVSSLLAQGGHALILMPCTKTSKGKGIKANTV